MDVSHHAPQSFIGEQERILKQRASGRMVYRFPRPASLLTEPVTILDIVRADEGSLEIRTLHSYVEELAMVWTHSLIQLHT